MSLIYVRANEVMDRSAALLNDPAKTDFTYEAQLVYLNMAIDELSEYLQESSHQISNAESMIISIPAGTTEVLPPYNLTEIQEIGERTKGSNDSFVPMGRREFIDAFPASNSLLIWAPLGEVIQFNPNGALTDREIKLKYIRFILWNAVDKDSAVGPVYSRSYLVYKTAAFCAQFIGENETRAGILNGEAEKALERIIGIDNKGKQQMTTRRRPFRAAFKARGGF